MQRIVKTMINHAEKGQNLLELIVVIAVAIIVISALVFATISSLRNAQFANNQAKATQLAQEGLEKLKIKRDRSDLINVDGEDKSWDEFWQMRISDLGEKYCYFVFNDQNDQLTFTNNCYPSFVDLTNTNSEVLEDGQIKRVVVIFDDVTNPVTDPLPNRKKFTSIVTWSDFSGSHESRLSTILGKL